MVTFRNNNNARRNNFRRNDRNFKSNGDRPKFGTNYSNNDNFKRKVPGRNNHNAPKLIEKYNDLAREASSSGDKILSENYLQHADHFTRVMNEQEASRKERFAENKQTNDESSVGVKSTIVNPASKDQDTNVVTKEDVVIKEDVVKKTEVVTKVNKPAKSHTKAI